MYCMYVHMYMHTVYSLGGVWGSVSGCSDLSLYIPQNNIGSLSDTRRIALTAPGGGVAYSRFGHAIAPLGDLDDDGFDGA